MPRISRKNLKSSFFHIMVQGINREYIFNSERNMKKYKEIILENLNDLNDSELNILSYCLMSNHTHFLMLCEQFKELSRFMHKVNMAYSRYYNKINNRVGYVFRDRFKVQEIMDTNQLFNCLRYIHNNPVKAKICNSMGDCKYSSYNEFFGYREIINDRSIELLFGSTEAFEKMFDMIHNNFKDENFIDVKSLNINEFAAEYIRKNNKSLKEIKDDKYELEKFIKSSRMETEITLTELAEFLKISKSKVGLCAKNK